MLQLSCTKSLSARLVYIRNARVPCVMWVDTVSENFTFTFNTLYPSFHFLSMKVVLNPRASIWPAMWREYTTTTPSRQTYPIEAPLSESNLTIRLSL